VWPQYGQRSDSWTWNSPEKLDLSCKGSLAEGEAHYFTVLMYQNSDRVVNGGGKENPHPQKPEGGAPAPAGQDIGKADSD